jgi:bifunctional non-homologous end joining protein LigD
VTVEIPRPGKALFPDGTTKADLAGYYEAIAPVMLPHLAGRPLNLERYPDGIDGERIIQQRAGRHFPDWIERVTVRKQRGAVDHVVATDADTLVYLAGQACITLHRWLCRADRIDSPDLMVIDLDPSNGTPADVRRAAREFGDLLRELGLEAFAMTTGSRGYHVAAPLQRRQDFDDVRAFARDLARLAAGRDPKLTVEQRKAKRGDRILIDVMRNAYAHTAVAPYAVRAHPGAPVATPLHWDELTDSKLRPDRWKLRTVLRRVERDGDPWAAISRSARALGPARRRLAALLAE